MRSLHLGLAAAVLVAALVPACSSDDGAASGSSTDGGVTTTSDGSAIAPDGAVVTLAEGGADAGPSCIDKAKNGTETDVDCGGSCAEKCKALQGCAIDGDCVTMLVCVKKVCAAATSTDGLRNGNETDIDCGGDTAPACDPTKDCKVAADCKEKVCDPGTKKCLEAQPDDGVKNGNETDVDCGGGAPAVACADTKACKVAADCKSLVCTARRRSPRTA